MSYAYLLPIETDKINLEIIIRGQNKNEFSIQYPCTPNFDADFRPYSSTT